MRVSLLGSSPRMRGTRVVRDVQAPENRIIPAHAGNSVRQGHRADQAADHPRACGELDRRGTNGNRHRGSSPRMRGTPTPGSAWSLTRRIIPAHAGNSDSESSRRTNQPDHPRACGELRSPRTPRRSSGGSSPRMRGTPGLEARGCAYGRIIPAHAGNSPRSRPAA